MPNPKGVIDGRDCAPAAVAARTVTVEQMKSSATEIAAHNDLVLEFIDHLHNGICLKPVRLALARERKGHQRVICLRSGKTFQKLSRGRTFFSLKESWGATTWRSGRLW
jgi:hypothetical protein